MDLEKIVKSEYEKKKAEIILREKLAILEGIRSMDDNELEKLRKKIRKSSWKIWKKKE